MINCKQRMSILFTLLLLMLFTFLTLDFAFSIEEKNDFNNKNYEKSKVQIKEKIVISKNKEII